MCVVAVAVYMKMDAWWIDDIIKRALEQKQAAYPKFIVTKITQKMQNR